MLEGVIETQQQATLLFGIWACFVALFGFFTAGLMVAFSGFFTNRVAKTSPDFEFARARLSACGIGIIGCAISLLGLTGGSLFSFLKAEQGQWWLGPVTLAVAVTLLVTRKALARRIARRAIPVLYRSLDYDQRWKVLEAVLLQFGIFVGWFGVILTVQIVWRIFD